MKELFTVEEVAQVLDVHTRTVRRYIKEDKLCASKVGGRWKVEKDELKRFMNNEEIIEHFQKKQDDILLGLMEGKSEEKVTLHTIVDFKVESEEEIEKLCGRVCNTINKVENGNIRFQYNYNKETGIGRFIFKGDSKNICKVVSVFEDYEI
ncbi:helix-turn-helix domain-containing protein [Oceanirhabdus sp. W0125-5]|uniref:helix-turn-helix domain-containing protein n=1 Tax=Oceanirhabdus sp. W0125-5 TaxID=2999116 RepID=UPI0022F2F433|nr:helix-turn-helix domain-containing protein [Oceanirhabdus sp. W0125-5]WBW96480.1 helix-turn-helix domain-containing protein [Oceanirhabdus sp. W0125-5]